MKTYRIVAFHALPPKLTYLLIPPRFGAYTRQGSAWCDNSDHRLCRSESTSIADLSVQLSVVQPPHARTPTFLLGSGFGDFSEGRLWVAS
eukprot:5797772-Amphidinium_carterae.2